MFNAGHKIESGNP